MANPRYISDSLYFQFYLLSSEFTGHHDMEYQQFLSEISNSNEELSHGKVIDDQGDIFLAFPEYSLATSVSADFQMNIGILRDFKLQFGNIERLQAENVHTGGVAYLNYDNKFVYYLVIKPVFYVYPTYYSVWLTLQALKDHVVANKIRKLACTPIGCDHDHLQWCYVKQMMEHIFKDVNVEIRALRPATTFNNNYEENPNA